MGHKDLEAWKRAIQLVKTIYTITADFPESEKFGLINQARRCAVSIPSNIAEGAARNSDKEMIRFLYISLGSLSELDTQLIVANEIGFFDYTKEIEAQLTSVRKPLLGLIKYLKSKGVKSEG